jgi:predicted ATPase
LQFGPDDTPEDKLDKLERALHSSALPVQEYAPLLAALLSVPLSERYAPLHLSPQKHKHKTQQALLTWLFKETQQRPVLLVWEDVHWADPSTLELLDALVKQVETVRLLMVLTFRPEFQPPWPLSDTITWIPLSRLAPEQTQEMVVQVARNTTLPPEVFQQVVDKTDGVPLFVEELTKMVIEAGLAREAEDSHGNSAPLPALAIPVTLQDSLMARLDQLAPVREIAQLGATLGREFSYALIQAIAPVDEATLQHGLSLLVDKELVHQKGAPPHARYVFKHVLIRDAAYASLLKSKRHQVHRQIAHVLESRFSQTVTDQPETLAHH